MHRVKCSKVKLNFVSFVFSRASLHQHIGVQQSNPRECGMSLAVFHFNDMTYALKMIINIFFF